MSVATITETPRLSFPFPVKKSYLEVLQAWEDALTYEATALAIGAPVGTVKSRLHRARKYVAAQQAKIVLTGEVAQ